MSFALAIIFDKIAVMRVVLNTRRYSRPLAFIRGFISFYKNYAWIWGPARVLTRRASGGILDARA